MKTEVEITEVSPARNRASDRGFTLVEIMVVIALLSVIVLGLMAMFNQVQRAFKAGMTQVDVLESGRMAMDMFNRELQEITPTYRDAINFSVELPPFDPVPQQLVASSVWRTNALEQVFFLTRENQRWIGTGYLVSTPDEGVGSLYRLVITTNINQNPAGLYYNFRNAPLTKFSRILDGVVQFRVRTFDTNNTWIMNNMGPTNSVTNVLAGISPPGSTSEVPGEIGYYEFRSNAVPAYVELELGVLEQQVWERYKSIPVVGALDPTPRVQFLRKQSGHVHLFRQRVAVRNVDSAAYPR
jgi:prepilin-type N-terminal cleavage/methylation domain-containing protein